MDDGQSTMDEGDGPAPPRSWGHMAFASSLTTFLSIQRNPFDM